MKKTKEYEQDAQKLMHELKNPPMIYEGKRSGVPTRVRESSSAEQVSETSKRYLV